MRLKKIPRGQTTILFCNPWPIDCVLHLNKKPFLFIGRNSFMGIEARNFIVGVPLKEFPEMQLYSNLKIEIYYL